MYLNDILQDCLKDCGLEMPNTAFDGESLKTAKILMEKLPKNTLLLLLSSLIETANSYVDMAWELRDATN